MQYQCDIGVAFHLGFAKIFSAAIFVTYFPYKKDTWIAATDYCMQFHLLGILMHCTVITNFKIVEICIIMTLFM